MFNILQDSSNNLQLPFKGNYDFLLISFKYRNKTVDAVFENTAGIDCGYEINIVEVGETGTVNVNNGQIKLSPRATWKATIYGQNNNTNLAAVNATELYNYDFQVKGENCKVYPTDVKSCPDATAIVNDQYGNELARKDIASGATGIIEVNTEGNTLYIYPYDEFLTGQDISYATGDDKDIADAVIRPEIESWPTNIDLLKPIRDPNDFTKLLKGATPSGLNWFGNLERFTDENGLQVYGSNYYIDHLTGWAFYLEKATITEQWISYLDRANTFQVLSKSDFHVGNSKQLMSIMNAQQINESTLNFNPLNVNIDHDTATSTTVFRSGDPNEVNRILQSSYLLTVVNTKHNNKNLKLFFRKAFTYDPNQDTTKLILT